MKAKHYYLFENGVKNRMKGGSLDKNNWDLLRMDEKESPFSIERDIAAYEENCRKALSYKAMAGLIVHIVQKYGLSDRKIISLGAGKGVLEWHMKKMMPDMIIECTDYTEKAIEKLKAVFPDMNAAYVFDMLDGEYSDLDVNAVYVMHRISTEFNINEWYKIFAAMYDAGIENMIFIPTGLDTAGTMCKEKVKHIKNFLFGKKDIFCGWLYSEKEFKKFFHNHREEPMYLIKEKIIFDKTAVYVLKRN